MKAFGACQVHDAGHTVGASARLAVEQRRRATRFVLGSARDAVDAALLLAALGLDPAEGRHEETAA